jgi:hypothetical protein
MGIKDFLFQRSTNQQFVQLLDAITNSISKLIPSPPRRHIASAKPLHRFIQLGFLVPAGGGTISFQVLIEHHLEQGNWVIGKGATTKIKIVKGLAVELVHLPFDNSCMIVFAQLLADLFPTRIALWQWKAPVPGFLNVPTVLNSW